MSPAPLQEHHTSGPPSCKLSSLLLLQQSSLLSFSLNSLMFFLLPSLKPMYIKTHHAPKHIQAQINKYSIDCQLSSFRFYQKSWNKGSPKYVQIIKYPVSNFTKEHTQTQICNRFPSAQFQITPKNTLLYFQNICTRLSNTQFQILSKKKHNHHQTSSSHQGLV